MKRLFVVFFVAIVIAGCNSDKSDWKKTQQTNTVDAYMEYIEKHQNGEFVDIARHKADSISFYEALNSMSLDKLKEYLENFSDGENSLYAKLLIDSIETTNAWQTAVQQNTVEAYKSFIKQFPDDYYVPFAKKKIDSLYLVNAKYFADFQEFRQYMRTVDEDDFTKIFIATVIKNKDKIDKSYLWATAYLLTLNNDNVLKEMTAFFSDDSCVINNSVYKQPYEINEDLKMYSPFNPLFVLPNNEDFMDLMINPDTVDVKQHNDEEGYSYTLNRGFVVENMNDTVKVNLYANDAYEADDGSDEGSQTTNEAVIYWKKINNEYRIIKIDAYRFAAN